MNKVRGEAARIFSGFHSGEDHHKPTSGYRCRSTSVVAVILLDANLSRNQ
jgi:hypothetical protein